MSAIADLQRHGFRKTAQRAVILEILENSERHLTAAQIADQVAEGDVALTRSTVYRTLETLVDVGMIKASQIGRSLYYEYLHDDHSHHHLVCSGCGATVHIHGAEIDASLTRAAAQAGFRVAEIQVLVGGVCRACRRDARKTATGIISADPGLKLA
jgi:Fe2+ or Zn2+ uptake regulation protein